MWVCHELNPLKGTSLCLRSTATQTPGGAALASSRDTSPHTIRGIGLHDNQPVLTQACRMSSVFSALFYPGRLIRNLVYALAMLRRCRPQLSLSAVLAYCKGMDILAQSAFWPTVSLAHLSRLLLSTQQLSSVPGDAFLSSRSAFRGRASRKESL